MTSDPASVTSDSSTRGTRRVAIVGAGSVGATIAYACLIRGVADTVALFDLNADKTTAEVLDLEPGHPVRADGAGRWAPTTSR